MSLLPDTIQSLLPFTARPEFFDIFGIGLVWPFFVVLSLWALKSKKPLPQWALVILFVIGVLGFIVDGASVYNTYLK